MQAETTLHIAGMALDLRRFPSRKDEQLRAWDAADEYLLNHLMELPGPAAGRILVVNDSFGVLTIALRKLPAFADANVTTVSDSVVSQRAIAANADRNAIAEQSLRLFSSFDLPEPVAWGNLELLIIKIPKSLAQLEDQLLRLRGRLSEDARVIGAAMSRNVHNSTLSLFEDIVGSTRTSLARKKARLILATPDADDDLRCSAPVSFFEVRADIARTVTSLSIASFPGVFCHAGLDHGTELMLGSMDLGPVVGAGQGARLTDLGCGTGVLGLVAAQRLAELAPAMPLAVTFADESLAAIASVNATLRQTNTSAGHRFETLATHCLDGVADNSQDLVLNNPPFHDASARTPLIALQMFRDAKRVLKLGGQLQVVANRHLGYHARLRKLFGNCDTLAANAKFVVLRAVKQTR